MGNDQMMKPGHTSLRTLWVLALMAISFALGCTGPMLAPAPNLYWATGVHPYDDVPQALRGTTVDIIYATDRTSEQNSAGELEYGYGRSHSLAVGLATIEMGRRYWRRPYRSQ